MNVVSIVLIYWPYVFFFSLSLSFLVTCKERGQFFKPCGRSCTYTCNDVLIQLLYVCLPYCKPGCDCHTGKISYELIIEHSHIIVNNLNKE